MDSGRFLAGLGERSRERFDQERRVLSFADYLALFVARPHFLGRNAAQYAKDVIDHFGFEEIARPTGATRRCNLFLAPFDHGRDQLVGQEECQQAFYRALCDFVREGRASRLILLHGPNGSAKTSFVQCLARAMVHYSRADEGALYSFSWVFPKSSYLGKRVGFDPGRKEGGQPPPPDSYANLAQSEIAALVPCGLRDHPIFLLPAAMRRELLDQLESSGKLPPGFRFSDHLRFGDLEPVSRRIFDSLLAAAEGNLEQVLAQVQVERFQLSRRYRRGIVTVEPQMHVDASLRQVTMDESYSSLPAVLRHIPLFELSGDLVDANRGLLEYSDMLKRPLDSFKYLLGTCENSRVNVATAILYLDLVLVGTTNDKYLAAFTRTPDFPSFKGRIELVRVPYLLDYLVEEKIYRNQLGTSVVGRHVAPHAYHLVALWGVLTRLRRPNPPNYPPALKEAVESLTPTEKADLYALGKAPTRLAPESRRELLRLLPRMAGEHAGEGDYEGSFGSSPREAKALLLAAAHSDRFACLHPVQLFQEIEQLLTQSSLYAFLQFEANGEYQDCNLMLQRVKQRYLALVDGDLKAAMGLVTDDEFDRLLDRYALHASAFLKKEQLWDPVSHREGPPDEAFLRELEERWQEGGDRVAARERFIGRIAAWSLDHPGSRPALNELFPDQFERLRQLYFADRQAELGRALRAVLDCLDGAQQEEAVRVEAEQVIDRLVADRGYCRHCIAPALALLAQEERLLV